MRAQRKTYVDKIKRGQRILCHIFVPNYFRVYFSVLRNFDIFAATNPSPAKRRIYTSDAKMGIV